MAWELGKSLFNLRQYRLLYLHTFHRLLVLVLCSAYPVFSTPLIHEVAVDATGPAGGPNEWNQQDALPIFRSIPEGIYISVGAERGFMAAAASPNVKGVVFLDREPNVIAFNQMNAALLAISRSREDYRYLRFRGNLSMWEQRLATTNLASDSLLKKVLSDEYWFLWQDYLNTDDDNWKEFHTPSQESFDGIHYLSDDALFNRLQAMAQKRFIQSEIRELGTGIQPLLANLIQKGHQIAALDISNAWWGNYLERDQLLSLIEDFSAYAQSNALFITSHGIKERGWKFYAFPNSLISQLGVKTFLCQYFSATSNQIRATPNMVTKTPKPSP